MPNDTTQMLQLPERQLWPYIVHMDENDDEGFFCCVPDVDTLNAVIDDRAYSLGLSSIRPVASPLPFWPRDDV